MSQKRDSRRFSRRCSTKSDPSASFRDREDRAAACDKRGKSARPLRPGPGGDALPPFLPIPIPFPSCRPPLNKSGRNAGGRKGKGQERNKGSRPQGRLKTGGKAGLRKPNAQTPHLPHFGNPTRGPRPSSLGIIRADHYLKITRPLPALLINKALGPTPRPSPLRAAPARARFPRPRRSQTDKKRAPQRPFPTSVSVNLATVGLTADVRF